MHLEYESKMENGTIRTYLGPGLVIGCTSINLRSVVLYHYWGTVYLIKFNFYNCVTYP